MRSTWSPFNLPWDDAPIDLSFIFEDERPAGKHGFLSAREDRMVFDDGTEGRFWGTNFNGGANFPTHEESERMSRRLAKFGLNMVRTHQMDAEWATPNLFQFNRAKPQSDTRTLDPESMDRLDYLIACLKQEGIYLYLDMLTYRKFMSGDGVEAADRLGDAAKPYTYFDPRLIELQKEFNRDLWTHVNPYTGLAYRDDPAIALTELKNECDLFTLPPRVEPYRTRLEKQYREWCEGGGKPVPDSEVVFDHPDAQMAEFFSEVQRDFYAEMIADLRNIGVKVPITGTNWSRNLAVLESHRSTDFTDTHWYWNFPTWDSPDGLDAKPMVAQTRNGFVDGVFQRYLDRPLFVSEWDHPWPDEWRSESPLAYAAVGAFQGWSGMTIHTYRYTRHGPADYISGGACTLNGVTYRTHFDTFNDPAKFGLFYHAALLFRRGDVSRAARRVAIEVSDEADDWRLQTPDDIPALELLPEIHAAGMVIPGERAVGADQSIPAARRYEGVDFESGEVQSDTGELGRSWTRRYGWIDTARTKAAYGFLGGNAIRLSGLGLDITTEFAVVALSSLTDESTSESVSLLLTAVGRCKNSGARFDESGRHQAEIGHGPVLVEPISGTVTITTSRPNLKVWILSEIGDAVIKVPTTYEEGELRFEIGPQPVRGGTTIYYLIRH